MSTLLGAGRGRFWTRYVQYQQFERGLNFFGQVNTTHDFTDFPSDIFYDNVNQCRHVNSRN